MVLTDRANTESGIEIRLLHLGETLAKVPLGIQTADDTLAAVVGFPEQTLSAINAFQRHASRGTEHHAHTTQSIVVTQRPFLIGTQYETVTELFIEIAYRHANHAIIIHGIDIGDAVTLHTCVEARKWGQASFVAHTCREIAQRIVDFSETIDAQSFAIQILLRNAQCFIDAIILGIHLETTANFRVT